jgi:hypothetical protein
MATAPELLATLREAVPNWTEESGFPNQAAAKQLAKSKMSTALSAEPFVEDLPAGGLRQAGFRLWILDISQVMAPVIAKKNWTSETAPFFLTVAPTEDLWLDITLTSLRKLHGQGLEVALRRKEDNFNEWWICIQWRAAKVV